MFVRRLQKFIDALSSEITTLTSFDVSALERLQLKYAPLSGEMELSVSDLNELNDLFAARWKAVFDTDRDYTVTAHYGNRAWISLAKKLSKELNTTLLSIIIPELTNTIDPDNLVNIHFIKDPDDIYLGEDGKTWHSVHALFDRLQRNPGHLLVQSTLEKSSARNLSLIELSRLQRKSLRSEACFDGHTSFWGFLLNTVTRSWTQPAHQDPHLLNLLSNMIEVCHLKVVNSEFKMTMEALWCDIDKYLKRSRLTYLRAFYSSTVSHRGQTVCLIDLLAKCQVQDGRCQENLHLIWRFVINRMAPKWQEHGSLPAGLLMDLVTLIDSFYEGGETEFLCPMTVFFEKLRGYPREDVNRFYSISIELNDSRQYLLEILLDSFVDRNQFIERIPLIVHWIHSLNPSLIAKAPQLDSVYLELETGPYFNLFSLQHRLKMLTVTPHNAHLSDMLHGVLCASAEAHGITPYLLNRIEALYAERWNLIMDKAEDYTRLWDGMNTAWIALAQSLAGAGLISKNYYSFLIPGLTHTQDLVEQEPYISYPLTDYILSEEKDRLINLRTSARYFKSNGLFLNCNYFQPRKLTSREQWRMQFAKTEFKEIFDRCELSQVNHGLSRMTVLVLKELVHRSVFAEGLQLGNVSVENLRSAYEAYQELLNYMYELPEEERSDWHQYRIRLETQERTFLSVLKSIVYERVCVASFGRFFIKLCLDYEPALRFSPRVEELAKVESMRRNSMNNFYRDQADSSDTEAGRRLLILMVCLLTHEFSILGSGYDVALGIFSNKVTHSGAAIFEKLAPAIKYGRWRDANTIYFEILDNIVISALTKGSTTRSADTLSWLQSIANGRLFSKVNANCFEPTLILSELSGTFSKEVDLDRKIRTVREKIHNQLMTERNTLLQWVNVNALFILFLRSLSESLRTHILKRLHKVSEPMMGAATVSSPGTLSEHSPLFFKTPGRDLSTRQLVLQNQPSYESCQSVSVLLPSLRPDQPSEYVGSSSTSTYH